MRQIKAKGSLVRLREGWRIQVRVIGALLVRELITRFGRENIGFLWIMAEPLLFAVLVGIMWRYLHGPTEHGIGIIAFVATGYIPLTMVRSSINRSIGLFRANGGLMYHRQITLTDFILARVSVEVIGAMMAYFLIWALLFYCGLMPWPADFGLFALGWCLYAAFAASLCTIIAPLSEVSEVLEKISPVLTYIMIPFSGTFTMSSWLAGDARAVMYYSPLVACMEMMRGGIFGDLANPIYDASVPVIATLVCFTIGLLLCRRIRRKLVVE